MGVLYTVLPLSKDARDWLDELEIPYPQKPSRWPTGSEIKQVLGGMTDCEIEVTGHGIGRFWQATIVRRRGTDEAQWSCLTISKYAGDEQPQELWFEKGSPELNEAILQRLVAICGPMVLAPDTGEDPKVIDA
jgi:hypothetical protein